MNKGTSGDSLKVNWHIINALRGLAALGVVVNHARGYLFSDEVQYALHVRPKAEWYWWERLMMILMQGTSMGSEFVILFFVLSGFSIAHSLSNTVNVSDFYKRRAVRLYPTYLLGLLWVFIVYHLIRTCVPLVYNNMVDGHEAIGVYYQNFISPANLLSALVYFNKEYFMLYPYWSLPLEVIFYLLAPWLVRKTGAWAMITIGLYTACWLLYGIAYMDPFGGYNFGQVYFLECNFYFLVGVLVYKYRSRLLQYFPLSKTLYFIATVIVFVLMILLKSYVFHAVTNKLTLLLSVVCSCWLLLGALKNNVTIRWLDNIGAFSYTLYVSHLATIFIMKIVAHSAGLGFYMIHNVFYWLAGVIVSVVVAYILYLLAERPSIRILERMRVK